MGFNASLYEGMMNNKDTASLIKRAIKNAITSNSVFFDREVYVDAFPVSANAISFRVTLPAMEGELNQYDFTYDTSNNKIKSMVI